MTLEIAAEAEAVLRAYDVTDAFIDEHHVGMDIRKSAMDSRGAYALASAMFFMPMPLYGTPVWDMYWQPLTSMVTKGEGPQAVVHGPNVEEVDEETINLWMDAALRLQHPVLRARLADVACEIGRFRHLLPNDSAGKKRTLSVQQCAIDGYIQTIERWLLEDQTHLGLWFYLDRALELSLRLRDADRTKKSRALLFARLDHFTTPFGEDRQLARIDEILWNRRKALAISKEEIARITTLLEAKLATWANSASPEKFDPHLAQDAADRLRRWRFLNGDQEAAQRAALTAGSAMEAAAGLASALTAGAWLADQALRYRDIGDNEAAARVEATARARADDAVAELQTFSVPITIPKDEFEKYLEVASGNSLEEGLGGFAQAGLTKKASIIEDVLQLANQLSGIIPITITGYGGLPAAIIGSVQDDVEGRAVHQAAQRIGMWAPFLNAILDRIKEKHGLNAELFVTWLSSAPLFPPRAMALVRKGMTSYFEGDYVTAIHVLVPQVEAAMRELLVAVGGSIMRPRPSNEGGGFRVLGFGEILNHSSLSVVPEDLRFHLRVLYQDARGINLRNQTAHGLMSIEGFGLGLANWVFHSLVMLGHLRVRRTPNPNDDPSACGLGTDDTPLV